MTPDVLPFAYLAAGAALVLAGQWCANANRRRVERARRDRFRAAAAGYRPTVVPLTAKPGEPQWCSQGAHCDRHLAPEPAPDA